MIKIKGVRPDMIANNLEPFEPTHPGDLLQDELEALDMTQATLAERIGVSRSIINEIIKHKRAMNTETALLIEAAIGTPADLMLNLQAAYNMQVTKANKTFMERLAAIRKVAAVL